MKIVLISSEFPPGPGGIGQHAYSLAKSLNSSDFEIIVLSPADYASEDEVIQFDKSQLFRIVRFNRSGPISTYTNRIRQIYSCLRKYEIKHVILTGKFPLWVGLLLKLSKPYTKTIAILHGSEVNLQNWLLRKFTHIAINKADQIVAVSSFTKSILPLYISSKREIHVIPNGIDVQDAGEVIIEDEIKLIGSPCLLTIGHVTPRKGQHRVIKALPGLVEKYPGIHYHMIGTPNTKKEVEQLAFNLGVGQHITFHNRVKRHEDLEKYYNACDIFMLLSENQSDGDVEGFGIVALEANLSGKPVVGAINCGIEDAVKNDFSGYLVDGNNSIEIAAAVELCLLNKERLEITSRDWARQHNWKNIVKMYIPILGA
jgi:glycosyltransferase involved in cell wall biosynthesis